MSVAVISSLYGSAQDRVGRQPEQTIDAEWIMVTDQPVVSDLWRVVHEPRPELGPRTAAKLAKFRPDLWTDADTTVWLDAAARLVDGDSLERLLEWAAGAAIAQWPHPSRRCLFDEADVSATVAKYAHQNLAGQTSAYAAAGMPRRFGLWATGVIVRNHVAGGALEIFGDRWLVETHRWSDQDQVSEPFVLWQTGHRPADLPHAVFANPAVTWDYHGRVW